MPPSSSVSTTRRQLAYEAARLMVDQGVQNHQWALRKVAERLGVRNFRHWPSYLEIEAALTEQQRLFRPSQPAELEKLRRLAQQAMQALNQFAPRLVGPVLEGTANATSPVRLHLFAEAPDQVLHHLIDQRIPWEETDCRLRYSGGLSKTHSAFRFVAGGHPVELVILPPQARGNPPINLVTELPERGAGLAQVRQLLAGTAPPPLLVSPLPP